MLTTLGNIIYSSFLLVIGILLDRFFESRPKLVTYYSHVAAGKVRVGNDSPVGINTHAIGIYNSGRKPALNMRVGHYPIAKDIQNMLAIFPPQNYGVKVLPDAGGEEIVFERLLPKQSITITYIYAGFTFNQITAYVRSDETEAKFLPVAVSRQYPVWILNFLRFFVFIGFVTTIYFGYVYGLKLFEYLNLTH